MHVEDEQSQKMQSKLSGHLDLGGEWSDSSPSQISAEIRPGSKLGALFSVTDVAAQIWERPLRIQGLT